MIRRLVLVPLLLTLGAGPAFGDGLRLTNQDLDAVLAQDESATPTLPEVDSGNSAPRRWWPLVASAVVPGLGELTTGYLRGIPMVAVDVAIWSGVVIKHNEGNDKEKEFEAFAEEHWSEERWRAAVEGGAGTPDGANFALWFPEYAGRPADEIPLYVSRAEDEREWFENAGKWDQFAWGWREYWDDVWNAANHPNFLGPDLYAPQPGSENSDTWFTSDNALMTPLRSEYIKMREASNSSFETRDTLLSAALLLRVVSVLQMVYLEGFVGRRYDSPDVTELGMSAPRGNWSASTGVGGSGTVAWRMSW